MALPTFRNTLVKRRKRTIDTEPASTQLPRELEQLFRDMRAVYRNVYLFGQIPGLYRVFCGWCNRRITAYDTPAAVCNYYYPEAAPHRDDLCFLYRCEVCQRRQGQSIFEAILEDADTMGEEVSSDEERERDPYGYDFQGALHPLMIGWAWNRQIGWYRSRFWHEGDPIVQSPSE